MNINNRFYLSLAFSGCTLLSSITHAQQNQIQQQKNNNPAAQTQQDLKNQKNNMQNDLNAKKAAAKKELEDKKKKAQEEALAALNRFKYIDLSFGVLPNSDGRSNSLSTLNINYNENLRSKFVRTDRRYGGTSTSDKTSIVETSTINTDEEKKTQVDRAEISAGLLEYSGLRFSIFGTKFEPKVGFGFDQYSEIKTTNESRKRSLPDPSDNTITRTIIEQDVINEKNSGYLPKVWFSIKLAPFQTLKFDFVSEFYFATREDNIWEQKGSAYIPPFTDTTSELIETSQNRETTFSSNGFRLALNGDWISPVRLSYP